jgi:hypothetical protein
VAALKRAEHRRAWQTPAPEVDAGAAQPARPLLGVLSPDPLATARNIRSHAADRPPEPAWRPVPPAPSLLLPRLDQAEKWLVTPSHATPAAHDGHLSQRRANALHSAFALVSPDAGRNSLARQNDPICAPQAGDPHRATGRPERRIRSGQDQHPVTFRDRTGRLQAVPDDPPTAVCIPGMPRTFWMGVCGRCPGWWLGCPGR